MNNIKRIVLDARKPGLVEVQFATGKSVHLKSDAPNSLQAVQNDLKHLGLQLASPDRV